MNKFIEMIKTTSVDTIVRTVVLFITLINGFCAMMGWSPLDISEETIYAIVSGLALVGASIWAWWRDNPFTKAGKTGSAITKAIKRGDITADTLEELSSGLEEGENEQQ